MEYKIISTNRKAFWHNQNGWVGEKSADVFSEKERQSLSLPADGCWVPHGKVQVKTVSDLAQFLDFLPVKMKLCPTFTHAFAAADACMTLRIIGLDEFGLLDESDDPDVVIEYGLHINVKM